MKIVEERAISIGEAREILEQLEKERKAAAPAEEKAEVEEEKAVAAPVAAGEGAEGHEGREEKKAEAAVKREGEEKTEALGLASGLASELALGFGEEVKEGKAPEKSYLGYEQKVTLEHLRKFATAPKTAVEKARAELEALGVIKDYQVAMILDTPPETKEELLVVLQKERLDLSDEITAKILEIAQKLKAMRKG